MKDSFCNRHCRFSFSLHDVSGKSVQILDAEVGWGWGRGNLHGDVDGDGEFFVGTGWGWGQFYGDGDNFIYHVTLLSYMTGFVDVDFMLISLL